ncbi:prepilin peptidase [Pseudonocardia halophobica]|uniref:prepilin peptidase n=1 Tax=Pseudonocardia halophobica TaxID=29401 RepID=UPI00068CE85B|nr:prepilin peptidase [Pseudonocardia halophobica]
MIYPFLGAVLGTGLCAPTATVLANRFTRGPVTWSGLEFAATAALLTIIFSTCLAERGLAAALLLVPLATLGMAAALVDARELRLPDPLICSLAAVTIPTIVLAQSVLGVDTHALAPVVLGALALSTALQIVIPRGWGWGDAKLLPILACWTGLLGLSTTLAAAAYAAVCIAVLAIWRGLTASPTATFPYGPALVGAALFASAIANRTGPA